MLERQNPKPLYAQLSDILRERIEHNEWSPNHAIPSENGLSREFGVSRMTARAVVSELVRDGLLYRVPGKGTYIAEQKITASSPSYRGIREQLEQMGYKTKTRLVDVRRVAPSAIVLGYLGLEERSRVYMIQRLRSVRNRPLSLHVSYVPVASCPGLEKKPLEDEQLCTILDNGYGLKRARIAESLESTLAGETEARMLGVRTGSPLLLLKDVISGRDGTPFEYTTIFFRGDIIKISFVYEE